MSTTEKVKKLWINWAICNFTDFAGTWPNRKNFASAASPGC